jgi:hypothetical protein
LGGIGRGRRRWNDTDAQSRGNHRAHRIEARNTDADIQWPVLIGSATRVDSVQPICRNFL